MRRYQNPDGTVTAAGKARYDSMSKGESKAVKQYVKAAKRSDKADATEEQYYKNPNATNAYMSVYTRNRTNKAYSKYSDKVSKLTDSEKNNVNKIIKEVGSINTSHISDEGIRYADKYIRTYYAGMFVGGTLGSLVSTAALNAVSSRALASERTSSQAKTARNRAVQVYKNKHPGTELSDKEIASTLGYSV